MPLTVHLKNQENDINLAFWQATEETGALLMQAKLGSDEEDTYLHIHTDKRKREWLCSKILLNALVEDERISNLGNGKPIIGRGRHISISHCGNFVGVIIALKNVGLDIQKPYDKIVRIAPKFCCPEELFRGLNSPHRIEYLTIMWSVKEAIFKFFGEGVHFAKDIFVHHFDILDEHIIADYNGQYGTMKFYLRHFRMDEFHVVYTI